jgi:hypothetical protein
MRLDSLVVSLVSTNLTYMEHGGLISILNGPILDDCDKPRLNGRIYTHFNFDSTLGYRAGLPTIR